MIVMALDRARKYWTYSGVAFQPEDLTRTTAVLFFARMIAPHLCSGFHVHGQHWGILLVAPRTHGKSTVAIPLETWSVAQVFSWNSPYFALR